MLIIEITPFENGAHRNQTATSTIPNGWAVDKLGLCKENFPFGEVTAEEIDGIMTVTSWTPLPIPEPEKPTPSQLREQAYQSDPIINYNDTMITVDAANKLFNEYFAEGNKEKYEAIQSLIVKAKEEIRKKYPDEGGNN